MGDTIHTRHHRQLVLLRRTGPPQDATVTSRAASLTRASTSAKIYFFCHEQNFIDLIRHVVVWCDKNCDVINCACKKKKKKEEEGEEKKRIPKSSKTHKTKVPWPSWPREAKKIQGLAHPANSPDLASCDLTGRTFSRIHCRTSQKQ